MSRVRFLPAFAALLLAALALVSCGGESRSDADPKSVLDGATLEGIESAELDATLDFSLKGAKPGNIEVSVSGPFESIEGGSLPQLGLTAQATGRLEGKDVDFDGGLVLLPSSAYIGYQGTDYEVDPTTFSFVQSTIERAQRQGQGEGQSSPTEACKEALAGALDAADYVEDATNRGEADVAGTATTRVSGELDVAVALDAMLRLRDDPACSSQLNAAGEQLPSTAELRDSRQEVEATVKSAHVDVYVGDDDIIRRITGRLVIDPPTGKKRSSGIAEFDLTLAGVNEEQEISAPATARPLNELFSKLGVNPLELLGALQGEGDGLGNLLEGLEAGSTS